MQRKKDNTQFCFCLVRARASLHCADLCWVRYPENAVKPECSGKAGNSAFVEACLLQKHCGWSGLGETVAQKKAPGGQWCHDSSHQACIWYLKKSQVIPQQIHRIFPPFQLTATCLLCQINPWTPAGWTSGPILGCGLRIWRFAYGPEPEISGQAAWMILMTGRCTMTVMSDHSYVYTKLYKLYFHGCIWYEYRYLRSSYYSNSGLLCNFTKSNQVISESPITGVKDHPIRLPVRPTFFFSSRLLRLMLGMEIREQVTNYVGKRIQAMRQGAEGIPSHHNVSVTWLAASGWIQRKCRFRRFILIGCTSCFEYQHSMTPR